MERGRNPGGTLKRSLGMFIDFASVGGTIVVLRVKVLEIRESIRETSHETRPSLAAAFALAPAWALDLCRAGNPLATIIVPDSFDVTHNLAFMDPTVFGDLYFGRRPKER